MDITNKPGWSQWFASCSTSYSVIVDVTHSPCIYSGTQSTTWCFLETPFFDSSSSILIYWVTRQASLIQVLSAILGNPYSYRLFPRSLSFFFLKLYNNDTLTMIVQLATEKTLKCSLLTGIWTANSRVFTAPIRSSCGLCSVLLKIYFSSCLIIVSQI